MFILFIIKMWSFSKRDSSKVLALQKQPFTDFHKIGLHLQIRWKKVLESLYNEVACHRHMIFIKTFFIELLNATTSDSLSQIPSRYYNKDTKMTSIEAIFLTSLPILKIFCLSSEIILEDSIQKNFSKSSKCSREISVAEFRYS